LKTLIVNADDFGLTPGVTDGIVRAMAGGIVASTSAMLCTPDGEEAIRAHAPLLARRAGIHLQLTGGRPRARLASVHSLLCDDGMFPASRRLLREPKPEEILHEWHCQVRAFLDCGLAPTHIDTHQHVHKEPAAFEAYCEIARHYGLPARSCDPKMTRLLRLARVECPDMFECSWTAGAEPTKAGLLAAVTRCFANTSAQIVELMCHPGYTDPALLRLSPTGSAREKELAVLCDPKIRGELSACGIVVARERTLPISEKEFR
jgi:predicted glycoside hydrolase/deacetylase ChbG (UPF0249 family)